MTTPRRLCRNSKAMTEQLIEQMLKGDRAPAEIAAGVGITLAELSDWARDDTNTRTLEGLARLADLRAQMLLSEYRATAAVRLIEIATDKEQVEPSRKACVDLLRADLGVFKPSEIANRDTPPPVPDERAILDALERLGREEEP